MGILSLFGDDKHTIEQKSNRQLRWQLLSFLNTKESVYNKKITESFTVPSHNLFIYKKYPSLPQTKEDVIELFTDTIDEEDEKWIVWYKDYVDFIRKDRRLQSQFKDSPSSLTSTHKEYLESLQRAIPYLHAAHKQYHIPYGELITMCHLYKQTKSSAQHFVQQHLPTIIHIVSDNPNIRDSLVDDINQVSNHSKPETIDNLIDDVLKKYNSPNEMASAQD